MQAPCHAIASEQNGELKLLSQKDELAKNNFSSSQMPEIPPIA